ncbi:3-hydroxyacyl-CoA dehydrogenase NAD-binding domain-containing protein [Oricola sp.]|uniref:3-hydroxyacyl-CoA dehydrogenase NAD-binding domain-containing protein n=1 Tax=Oricola sp. TaxID=1979950 RepID=UPI0025F68835|nr:3-hydroxyacyl-CoA dehydrogenase NAD-binding domain-containing protein [Oricola sp.]MCI5074839.1 3-hydroxyacyl-CoA dehydrogenase NAD-binding domain-containing protein [Oricola sp.]
MSTVLVIGGGLIGAGWAGAFAGAGHETVVLDPDPAAAARVEATWLAAHDVMDRLGTLSPDAMLPRHVTRTDDIGKPGFVQEALPESLALKREVLAGLAPCLPAGTPVASSSSSFTADAIGHGLDFSADVLIGHPCNPPYLMPVVEIAGGAATSDEALARARAFYEAMGKTVLELRRPVAGHLVNRLQAALWREAVHLVATGAASLADTERAVTEALAPRWCRVGPNSVFALAGGDRGMGGFLDALGPQFEALWDDLGTPRLDAETCAALVRAYETAPLAPLPEQAADRDQTLPVILSMLASLDAGGAAKD